MLSHLLYVSKRSQTCTDSEIEKILQACKRNNASIDITGVLLYSDTNFVQYLEGDYKQIVGLYDRIKSDPRHRNAVLIANSPITERIFPSWQMGAKKINDKVQYLTEIDEEDKKEFTNILEGKSVQGTKALALMHKFFK